MSIIKKYFPDLTDTQYEQFDKLNELYSEWNQKINVVSRKDLINLTERHILHSLSIGKLLKFKKGTQILDVGTGGGFPGIPLAILFPEVEFYLIDAIRKKILVVNNVARGVGLKNVRAEQKRVEDVKAKYDFIVSRAVTAFPRFTKMVQKNVSTDQKNALPNGILYLKGGDFSKEIKRFGDDVAVFKLSDYFEEEFYETKKIVYLPV